MGLSYKTTVALVALILCLAGCGGGSSSAASQKAATVSVRSTSSLGDILVDGRGRTLYMFTGDKHGSPACSRACTRVWPPLITRGKPRSGGGLAAGKLGTITRKGGAAQVTYNGHPLYRYVQDSKPGETKGEDNKSFGGRWYAISPTGLAVKGG
jgi:predicted lipoprotein with Yx(FWY)xxD motif